MESKKNQVSHGVIGSRLPPHHPAPPASYPEAWFPSAVQQLYCKLNVT